MEKEEKEELNELQEAQQDEKQHSHANHEHDDHKEHHHEHHHHHHHHDHHGKKHVDGSERFKIHSLSASKRRKLMEKGTFFLLCAIAIIVTLLCIILYNVEN